jgi:hypothetical protein
MLRVNDYCAASRQEWDDFIRSAKNGHFLFYRDYMDYHADRFPDASLMFYDGRDRLIAVLPATLRDGVLASHAGLTFGGVVCGRSMKVELMLDVFAAMCASLRERGVGELIYKPVPHIYHQLPAEEDLYALVHHGARLIRRDVSTTIDRRMPLPFSKGRDWALRQAARNRLGVRQSFDFAGFMAIEQELLRTKYDAQPTHSAAELELLAGRFPDNIKLFAAFRDGGGMLGGAVIYETARVAHAQYIGASEEGHRLGALDLIFHHLIRHHYATKDWFDFGISPGNHGRELNSGLIRNKESYGARATTADWYSLDLSQQGGAT